MNKPTLSAFAIPFILICQSCAVGPDFISPTVELPSSWDAARPEVVADSAAANEDLSLVDWWTKFQDPLLSSLVQRAFASNLSLAQAKERVIQAREARISAYAGLWPELNLSGDARRTRGGRSSSVDGALAGVDPSSTTRRSASTRSLFQAGFDASWEIDLFGGNRRAVQAATADEAAVKEGLRDVRISLVAEVASNYLTLRSLQERLRIARENLETQRASARIASKRYDAGFADALDVSNAEAEAATTDSRVPELEAQINQQVFTLSVLLAQPPAALFSELEPVVALPSPPARLDLGVPADVLRRRPDIRQAEANLEAETARVGVAIADLFPRLSLSAAIGLEGDRTSALGYWDNHFWDLGSAVVGPVFDSGRRRAVIRGQESKEREALTVYHEVILNALKDVEGAYSDYQFEQRKLLALEAATRFNKKAFDIATERYRAGSADFLTVLTAERSLFVTQEALAVSHENVVQQVVALYKALGGGWGESDPEEISAK